MTSNPASVSAGAATVKASAAPVEKDAGFALLLPLLIAQALVTADFTCMNSMVGSIASDLNSSLTGLQTTMALSFLVMGALIIPASRIGDRRGHARVMALGAVVLAIGVTVTALSPTLAVLIIGKALIAAIGAALLVPAIFSLATLEFEGAARKRAIGLINVQLGIGTIAGAFIGGWMATNTSWRMWFGVEVVISIVLVLLMRPHFTERLTPRVLDFDMLGTLLSFVGLALIVLGFIQASAFGFVEARQDFHLFGATIIDQGGISPTIPMVVLGLLVLGVFAWYERHRIANDKEPLVHLDVLGNQTVRAGGAALALNFLIMGAGLFVLPVFGSTTLGWSATKAGGCVGAIALTLTFACLVTARLLASGRVSARTLAQVGFAALCAVSVLLALAFQPSSGFALLTGLGMLLGFAVGIGMVTLSVIVQGAAPPERTSDVSGLTREGAYVAQSIGVAAAGAVMIALLVSSLDNKINDSPTLSAAQKASLVSTLNNDVEVAVVTDTTARTVAQDNQVEQAALAEIVAINGQSRDIALSWAMLVVTLAAAIAFVFTLRIPAPTTGSDT